MNRPAITVLLSIAVGSSACDNNPSKGKTQAVVSGPAAVASSPATAAANYVFSNEGSKIEFVGAKLSSKHDGAFQVFSGTLKLVDNNPEKSFVSVEVDVGSIKADADKLTAHLKSPDFLDVAKFAKARFASTSVKAAGDKGATHTITGNLELHGVTKSIMFPATLTVAGDAVDVDAEFAINRKVFAIVYPGLPDDLIKDDVLIKLQIRSKKAP